MRFSGTSGALRCRQKSVGWGVFGAPSHRVSALRLKFVLASSCSFVEHAEQPFLGRGRYRVREPGGDQLGFGGAREESEDVFVDAEVSLLLRGVVIRSPKQRVPSGSCTGSRVIVAGP